ncbi:MULTISPECIES: DUF7219 family protein [Aerosakkonema]|uniref:DUF7219 family protein n=1 Tax=Aerosakkonema TaxID=1246629 RepID=UPI0035BAAAF9
MPDRSDFIYPRKRYRGRFTPQHLVFNANLQEFAHKISYICNLETSGKLPPDDAYEQIKYLWEQLEQSKKALGIDIPSQSEDESSS